MDPAELSAQRIADRGREVLVTRLRDAFEKTAAAHSGLVQLDGPQLDRMALDAVDRAGGALWRRSLAEVAMTELDISLAEAYDHPAVLRAQEMLGVPVYGSAEVRARPEPAAPVPAAPPAQPLEHDGPADPATLPAPDAIRVGAIHLEGIETLRPGARNIELRFSDIGMDVINTRDGESIGRLTWSEIVSLELPRPRRSLRRRRGSGPELIVTSDRGLARFELRGISDEEAREHLAPVLSRGQQPAG